MRKATCQAISCETVFEMFYMHVWMEGIHYCLNIVGSQRKMETVYFQRLLVGPLT